MDDFFKQFDAASSQFHEAHQRAHNHAHQQAHQHAHQTHQNHFNFDFNKLFDDDDGFGMDVNNADGNHYFGNIFGGDVGNNVHVHTSSFSESVSESISQNGQQSCRTVTRRQGNSVSTVTECH
jgi:hypothetical protein